MANEEKAIKLPNQRNSVEKNRKVLENALNSSQNVKALRESVKSSFRGLDILDKKNFPVHEAGFSLALMKKKLMQESAASTGFPQLLRAGVQMAFNNMVEQYTGTTYEEWTQVTTSDKDTELYAPLDGLSFLGERGPTEKYQESQIAGLDLKLKNRYFGQILAIDESLYDDDQTGQLQKLVGDLAEWTKLLYEVYCYGKLASVSGQSYAGLKIPQSETQPSYEANYPWTSSSSPFKGGGFNKPTSFGVLNQANIQTGVNGLLTQLNQLGLIMNVNPKGLLCGVSKQFDAMVLMQSTLNPSMSSTASADIGKVGSINGVNPIKSILDVTVSRYMFNNSGSASSLSTAWYIVDKSKPWFTIQLREPGSVVQENPEAGESFERDIVRHKLKVRMNADFINPRFAWQGSDGSV